MTVGDPQVVTLGVSRRRGRKYTRTVADAAQPDFETAADVSEWADRSFSATDRQIVIVVARIFRGILDEKDAQGEDLAIYKQMDLESIPDILNRVEWCQSVPEVGAELLSRFILAHPMPNTNHRTGIGLLDRYLSSYDETFAMPDTGEDDRWYDCARDYIHDSKRLLTLRNYYPVYFIGPPTTATTRSSAKRGFELTSAILISTVMITGTTTPIAISIGVGDLWTRS